MKFLQKLAFTGGMIGSMAMLSLNANALHLGTTEKIDSTSILSPLAQPVTVTNPYAAAAQSFTIAEPNARTAEALATTVTCGGHTWTDGQILGTNNDRENLQTAIIEGRIYIRIGGQITNNRFHLFQAHGTPFPNTPENDAMFKKCINDRDPSTAVEKFLGAVTDEGIYCNGKLIKDKMPLGVYIGGDNVRTYQFARVDRERGILRHVTWRDNNDLWLHSQENKNIPDYNGYGADLLEVTVKGENGSYMYDTPGLKEYKYYVGCFYNNLPLYPDAVVPSCTPTITNITSTSQTGLTFTFGGDGVASVKWRLRRASDNAELASGVANSSTSNISFGSQPYGNYRLEIEGNNCSSSPVRRDFSIVQPQLPACTDGPRITGITNVTSTTATINYAGSNLQQFSWRILNATGQEFEAGETGRLSSKSTNIAIALPAGNYTFELTAKDCIAPAPVTSSFVVNGNDSRAACKLGPALESVVNYSHSSLAFRFDGEDVFAIDWKLKRGAQTVAESRVRPTSNTPVVNYNTLIDGQYTLEISGGSCRSNVTRSTFQLGALPIHIANFKGKSVEQGVELSWDVVSEKDGAGFEVLRLDSKAQHSEVIGEISLTDKKTGVYTFTDKAPNLGTNYYQLKQIDLDGTFTRSNIIAVTSASISGTIVAPNPAKDYVDVQFSSRTSGNADLEIYNISGVRVQSSKIQIIEGKNVHRVGVSRLHEGNYFMKISHNGETSKLRFVKVN